MPAIAELATRHCTPLRGPDHRLSAEDARGQLELLPVGWSLAADGDAIHRTFKFDDYYRTMAFVNALAFIAHREDHHPDLGVHFNRVEVRYSTHDVGGLSENDFICAAKAEALFL